MLTADPTIRLGDVVVTRVGGPFADPFVTLRLVNAGRVLLFDLGDPGPLPVRVAHAVTDVFVSHAHLDHFSGFLWLLRARMGELAPCRIFGPPGLADRVSAFVGAFTWDRIGDRGPRFDVRELHGDNLRRWTVQAGLPRAACPDEPAPGRVVHAEPAFQVRAAQLDHAGLPVLAWCYEETRSLHIRPEALDARSLRPGPWLAELKRLLHEGRHDELLAVPGLGERPVAELADALVVESPGRRVAYATDFGDTQENRRRLVELARGADLLVCEATFVEADAAQASRTGHLTTRACREIAAEAGVGRLLPFHFSSRYEEDPSRIIAELA